MYNATELNARLPYCFGNEIEYLQDLAAKLPRLAKVCMLGAGPGIMTMALLEGNPSLIIHAIDMNEEVLATFNAHLEPIGYAGTVFTYCKTTEEACGYFPDHAFDFMVIDADHTYNAVVKDIRNYWPKLKLGGLVFFHDVVNLEQDYPNGVHRAIQQCIFEHTMTARLRDQPGISQVYEKLP